MPRNATWQSFANDVAVNSIDRAVELARDWQASGRFDLFRGQSAPWPLIPSQLRIPDEDFPAASERMGRFFRWISSSAGLSDINGHMDSILAVAQHYGLPTCLLDFTFDVDVAAFFATHSKHREKGGMACLVCLHSTRYLTVWNQRRPETIEPLRLIDNPVPDLWRLQAQKGCFLEVRYLDIELVVPPQRILFPLDDPWARPPADEIYPTRKSRVEVLLDHYFEVERTIAGNVATDEWLDQLRKRGVYIPQATKLRQPRPFLEKYVVGPAIDALPHWDTSVLTDWLRQPGEQWHEVKSDMEVLIRALHRLDFGGLVAQLTKFLADNPGIRGRLCRFRVQDDEHVLPADQMIVLETRLVRLWDGMRNLPYSDDQVAKAIARTVALELTVKRENLWSGRAWHGVFESAIPDMIKVALGMPDGTGGAAFLPGPMFRSALRRDLRQVFRPEAVSMLEKTSLLLQIITSPEILFCFDSLVELFAQYLIPTQILMRDIAETVVFNPVSLVTFGAP